MNNDTELRRRMAAAAAVEIAEAVEATRRVADEVERVTGYRVLSPERRSITDATRTDLQAMLAQVRAGERALTMALGWVTTGTLGNALKTMPTGAAEDLSVALMAAGLLPAQD